MCGEFRYVECVRCRQFKSNNAFKQQCELVVRGQLRQTIPRSLLFLVRVARLAGSTL